MNNKLEIMFKNININGLKFLFSSIFWENETPYISYIRLIERDKIVFENPILTEQDIYNSIIPQLENAAAVKLNKIIQKDYEFIKKAPF